MIKFQIEFASQFPPILFLFCFILYFIYTLIYTEMGEKMTDPCVIPQVRALDERAAQKKPLHHAQLHCRRTADSHSVQAW